MDVVEAWFAAQQAHVERWREVGGPWRPYDGPVPVAAMQEAALGHPDAKVRRAALEVLDHEANDESVEVFRAALADPVPRVRLLALHGLACDRCRVGEVCASEVAGALATVVADDPSPKVRHAAVETAFPFLGRDPGLRATLARVALEDPDALVRQVAAAALDGRPRDVRSRKALRRRG